MARLAASGSSCAIAEEVTIRPPKIRASPASDEGSMGRRALNCILYKKGDVLNPDQFF
jgi:hypothetical protein